MVELNNLSRIGFGAYRASKDSIEHQRALCHALKSGCNLIDTSSNYLNGKSEMLIGKITTEKPYPSAFIITKAGYIQGANLAIIKALNQKGQANEDLISFSEDYKYSIHPDFLREQIKLSLRRLQKEQIDGFLLHNPEHYFKQKDKNLSQEGYYHRIQKAFEFLEDMVLTRKIRYYGISSNTFPFSTDIDSTTNLHRVMEIAKKVASNHHFKLIQFPFNFFEKGALKPHHDGTSLIKIAQKEGIITLSNRPLNANTQYGPFRIATYKISTQILDDRKDDQVFAKVIKLVKCQMEKIGLKEDPMDQVVLQFLRDSRREMNDTEFVNQIFQQRVYPFLHSLYGRVIPKEDMETYAQLHYFAILYSKKTITTQALNLRKELIENGIISEYDQRPLSNIACDQYLQSGIGHVLVGMRNRDYVESLKELFL